MANYCQVVRRMILSDAGMVFVEGNIQTIMEAIFNSPMLSPGVGKSIHTLQRSNRIAYLRGFNFTHGNMGTNHTKACQS